MSEEFIPLSVPHVRGNEWQYVKECLDTEWLSYVGPYVSKFEEQLAKYTDSQQAIATVSGTAAIHCALKICGVDPGDEVVMPALSFVAPANAVRYCGAYPTFIDIDKSTWQWDLNKVEDFLTNSCVRQLDGTLLNKETGRRVAALLPVHLLGSLIDRIALFQLSKKYSLPLVEDNAESLGAKWENLGIGHACLDTGMPHMSCTSFNGNKIMTTGGGGAALTNDAKIAEQFRHLSTTAKIDPIEFDHDALGYNYRMTNIAAAIGCAQLENLPYYVTKKRGIAKRYQDAFEDLSNRITLLPEASKSESSYWLYTIQLNTNSRPLLKFLQSNKIQTRPLWRILSDLPYLKEAYVHSDNVSREMVDCCLCLPSSVGLSESDQMRVVEKVVQHVNEYQN